MAAADLPDAALEIRALGWRRRLAAVAVAGVLKLWHLTLRWELVDHAGVTRRDWAGPLIWCFWHNRILAVSGAYRRAAPWRNGAVMTSASHDGAFLAAVMRQFGVGAVRGSSSRRGRAALLEMRRVLEAGGDAVLTPDGPRGPRYSLAPGVVRLAQQTGAGVMLVRVEFSRAKMLKTWDALRLPLPFSRVRVVFEAPELVPAELADDEFERVRAGLEARLLPPEVERALEPQKNRK